MEKARIAGLFVTLSMLAACNSGGGTANAAKQARMAAPVLVASATQETIPLQLKAIGNVEAIESVAIRAQVQGQLDHVYFQEGRDVKKGELLFQIDPRVYEDAVAQAEANLARERAAVAQAEANVSRDEANARLSAVQTNRFETLAAKGVISRDQNDQMRTTAAAQQQALQASRAAVDSAKAGVKADEAAVQDAKVKLSFTQIRSPITGRTGSLTVKEGNLVSVGGDPPLVMINQITPIYVTFALPEQHLSAVRSQMAKGRLRVEAIPAQGGGAPSEGWLAFVENSVDAATGTIKCKASFPNENRGLWPGEFVNVVITVDTIANAVLVPSQAVQTGQRGNYVFVIKPDSTAEQRSVTSTRQYKNLAVIDQGVRPGERVVIDGHLKVVPGAKVQILSPGANATSGAITLGS